MIELKCNKIGKIYPIKNNNFDNEEFIIGVGTPLLFLKQINQKNALVEDAYGNKLKVKTYELEDFPIVEIPNKKRLSLYNMEYFIYEHCSILKIFSFIIASLFAVALFVFLYISLYNGTDYSIIDWLIITVSILAGTCFFFLGVAFDFFYMSTEVLTYTNPINKNELEILLEKQKKYNDTGYFNQFKMAKVNNNIQMKKKIKRKQAS